MLPFPLHTYAFFVVIGGFFVFLFLRLKPMPWCCISFCVKCWNAYPSTGKKIYSSLKPFLNCNLFWISKKRQFPPPLESLGTCLYCSCSCSCSGYCTVCRRLFVVLMLDPSLEGSLEQFQGPVSMFASLPSLLKTLF